MDAERPTIRVFVSSPSDVRPERLLAERIVARLDREFAYHFHVEAVLWEREPLLASRHFQDPQNIPPPRGSDIVVVILWSRLGIPLPEGEYRGAITGRPVTGTEWEFEDALASARERGVPELLLYRKKRTVTASLDDERELEQRRLQKQLVDDFIARWFGDQSGAPMNLALQTFQSSEEFEEQLYTHLRGLLERRVQGEADSSAIRWYEAPFRGLLSFEPQHGPVFFGRARARSDVREILAAQEARHHPVVVVLGASGSGKSSLVKAGVLPDLMLPGMVGNVALCRYAILRPSDGGTPIDALAQALLSETGLPELNALRYTPHRLASLLSDAPEQAALPIEQGLDQAAREASLTEIAAARLLLVVDQLEEIFTIASLSAEERERFITALDALTRCGFVWIIATLRSDFFNRVETSPALARFAEAQARYLLLPPTDSELHQIICEPAREAGLRFETDADSGVSLSENIREAAARDRNALPLLSFVLDELWRRRTDRGVLTFAAYQELGGLEGALAERAEATFHALDPHVQAALPRVLRSLVMIGADGRVSAKWSSVDRFAAGSPERALIDAFAGAHTRLFVLSTDTPEGTPRVRVAHEAIFDHWSRARELIEDARADLQVEARLAESAARWRSAAAGDRESLLLAEGLPLEEATSLVDRFGDDIDPEIRAYVEASQTAVALRHTQEQRRQSRFASTMQVFGSAMLVVALVAVWWNMRLTAQQWSGDVNVVQVLPQGIVGVAHGDKTIVDCSGTPHRLGARDRAVRLPGVLCASEGNDPFVTFMRNLYRPQVIFALTLFVLVVLLALALSDVSLVFLALAILAYGSSAALIAFTLPSATSWGAGLAASYLATIGFLTIYTAFSLRIAISHARPLALIGAAIVFYGGGLIVGVATSAIAIVMGLAAIVVWMIWNRRLFVTMRFWLSAAAFAAGAAALVFYAGSTGFTGLLPFYLATIYPPILAALVRGAQRSYGALLLAIGLIGWFYSLARELALLQGLATVSGYDSSAALTIAKPWVPIGLAWVTLFALAGLGTKSTRATTQAGRTQGDRDRLRVAQAVRSEERRAAPL